MRFGRCACVCACVPAFRQWNVRQAAARSIPLSLSLSSIDKWPERYKTIKQATDKMLNRFWYLHSEKHRVLRSPILVRVQTWCYRRKCKRAKFLLCAFEHRLRAMWADCGSQVAKLTPISLWQFSRDFSSCTCSIIAYFLFPPTTPCAVSVCPLHIRESVGFPWYFDISLSLTLGYAWSPFTVEHKHTLPTECHA